MNEQQESPMQEAISYITIAAVIIGAVLFYAGMHNVPVLSWALYHVAVWIYGLIPALRGLCCSAKIANWISQGQLASIDRQTAQLKKNRAKIQARRRAKDGFDVR
jgi:uncharacterized membrane protein YiaA